MSDKKDLSSEGSEARTLIVSDVPIEGIWTQLSMWESSTLAAKLIRKRIESQNLRCTDEQVDRKASSLSYCLRNAREYLRDRQAAITPRVVANYYGCMWLASAMLVANPGNSFDLEKLEAVTKSGHGLGNLSDEGQSFPNNEFIYIRESGFFPEFLRAQGLSRNQLNAVKISGAPIRTLNGLDTDRAGRLIAVLDIVSRIPELKSTFEYVTDKPSLSFGISYAFVNYEISHDGLEGIANFMGNLAHNRDHTWVSLTNVAHLDREFLEANAPPLTDYQLRTEDNRSQWNGKLAHSPGQLWQDAIKSHKSAMCGTSWINPLLGYIDDPFSLNLMLLYELSILARYRPAVWRQIIEGNLDQYRALIEGHNQVVDRIIPELALASISDKSITATTSGSFNAPI